MNITAFSFGSTGDVEPFIALGTELKNRGHRYTIAAFPEFENEILKSGLIYRRVNGDVRLLMKILLSDRQQVSIKSSIEDMRSMLKLHEDMGLSKSLYRATADADLILYMQFGGLAYHFAEKRRIPCIRTFVYPNDPTRLYAPLLPELKRNTSRCKVGHYTMELLLNLASLTVINQWRARLGLRKWHLFRTYRRLEGEPVTTLYQYSKQIAPPDPKWGAHIHITGPWSRLHTEAYQPDGELLRFLAEGEVPLFIGFGSMLSGKIARIEQAVREAVLRSGQRAILVSSWAKLDGKQKHPNLFYMDYVPYTWLFPRVKAVVHHGGSGTTHLGLLMGRPTFIIAFGADQMFWGQQVARHRLGPEPVCAQEGGMDPVILTKRFLELQNVEYQVNAEKLAKKLRRENGTKTACDLIEQHFCCSGTKERKNERQQERGY